MDLKCYSSLSTIAPVRIEVLLVNFIKNYKSYLPAGNVRLLAVTEKQFSEMVLIVGGKTRQEETVSDRKLVII